MRMGQYRFASETKDMNTPAKLYHDRQPLSSGEIIPPDWDKSGLGNAVRNGQQLSPSADG